MVIKDADPDDQRKVRFVLSHVCKHWRAIALIDGMLWTSIDTRDPLDCVTELYSRSRGRPLRITIGDHSTQSTQAANNFIRTMLVNDMNRVEHLHIVLQGLYPSDYDWALTHNLRLLTITAETYMHMQEQEEQVLFSNIVQKIKTSKLEAITIQLSLFRHNIWQNICFPSLRFMSIGGHSRFYGIATMVDAIRGLPHLETLHLRDCFPVDMTPLRASRDIVTLNHLDTISITARTPRCHNFLTYLCLPVLKSIEIDAGDDLADETEPQWADVERVVGPLIQDITYVHGGHSSQLEHLTISAWHVKDVKWDHIHHPQLQTLKITLLDRRNWHYCGSLLVTALRNLRHLQTLELTGFIPSLIDTSDTSQDEIVTLFHLRKISLEGSSLLRCVNFVTFFCLPNVKTITVHVHPEPRSIILYSTPRVASRLPNFAFGLLDLDDHDVKLILSTRPLHVDGSSSTSARTLSVTWTLGIRSDLAINGMVDQMLRITTDMRNVPTLYVSPKSPLAKEVHMDVIKKLVHVRHTPQEATEDEDMVQTGNGSNI